MRDVPFDGGAELEAAYGLEVETLPTSRARRRSRCRRPDWMRDLTAEGEPIIVGAFDGDELVGMAVVVIADAPPGTALHWMTATRQSYRRRGLARALKHASLVGAAARGAHTARTFNDSRNLGMRAVNEEFGFEPTSDLLIWNGPCST